MGSCAGRAWGKTDEGDQAEQLLKTGVIIPVATLADVPVTANTAYLIDIDGCILTNIQRTKKQGLSIGVYDWWTSVMYQMACQMYIVTARDESSEQTTLNQLARASIIPMLYDGIYFQDYKGGVLRKLLPKIGTRRIVCIDDQFANLIEYYEISPRARLYIVNPHIKVECMDGVNQILVDDRVAEHIPDKYWSGEGK
jgi:hypothetical protein